MILEGQLN